MKKLISTVLLIVLFISTIPSCASERINTMSEWAQPYVQKACDLSLLDGDSFSGDLQINISREEYAALIYNALNACGLKTEASVSDNPFKDTENEAVLELYNQGIICGKTADKFAPDDFLTREEGAEILFRSYMKMYPDTKLNKRPSVPEYEDDAEISDWAYTGVYIISAAKIMQGTGDNRFSPKASYTKEEAVTAVIRLYEKYITQDDGASFADNLNKQMPADKNYMFSPLSVKMALSLAANGAEGETKDEIIKALGISDLELFNTSSKDLILRYSQTENLKLDIANSIWINSDKTAQNFSNGFKALAKEYYSADVKAVEDKNAVEEINSWVSEKTNEKITKIVEDNDFWSLLVNAIYFKGIWENEFNEIATKPDNFTSADGTVGKIDFMNRTGRFGYGKTMNSEIIELPYKTSFQQVSEDGEFLGFDNYDNLDVSMYLIASDKNISPEKELNEALLTESLKSTYVKLSVPKFKFEFSTGLNESLKNMGIKKAFEQDAEFTKMFDKDSMWFTNTVHKTYIAVDEKGTEAAAVTAIHMMGASIPPEPIELKFNKPFYFLIRDNVSSETLFLGRFAYGK